MTVWNITCGIKEIGIKVQRKFQQNKNFVRKMQKTYCSGKKKRCNDSAPRNPAPNGSRWIMRRELKNRE